METKEKIAEYAELYKAILKEVGDESPGIVLTIIQEIGKDRRCREIRETQMPRQQRATYKQIAFLKDLGISFDEKAITKRDASVLIEQAKAQQSQEV